MASINLLQTKCLKMFIDILILLLGLCEATHLGLTALALDPQNILKLEKETLVVCCPYHAMLHLPKPQFLSAAIAIGTFLLELISY